MADRDVRLEPRAAAPSIGPIRGRFALLVGIDSYLDPAIPPLRFCVNDVLALKQRLTELGYLVVALHDQAREPWLLPTRDNIEAELVRITSALLPEDLLYMHFAGHGRLIEGQPVLVARDSRLPTLAQRGLPLSLIERLLRESPARRLVVTLDACHSGVDTGRGLEAPAFNHHVFELAEGFALIAGSTAQQVAQECPDRQHGIFTYFLLQALAGHADRGGDGYVTVDDVKNYVLYELRRWSLERGGLLQEPTARVEGMGDIILAEVRDRAPAPQPPAAPVAAPVVHEDAPGPRLVGPPIALLRTVRESDAAALHQIEFPLYPGLRQVDLLPPIRTLSEGLFARVPKYLFRTFIGVTTPAKLLAYYRAQLEPNGWRDVTLLWLKTLELESFFHQMEAAGGGQVIYQRGRQVIAIGADPPGMGPAAGYDMRDDEYLVGLLVTIPE